MSIRKCHQEGAHEAMADLAIYQRAAGHDRAVLNELMIERARKQWAWLSPDAYIAYKDILAQEGVTI